MEEETDVGQLGSHASASEEYDDASDPVDDRASIGGESAEYDSEDRDTSQDIVTEVQRLYECDKIEVITELVRSRIHQARVQHKVDVFQLALEKSEASKTKLQLELAYSNRILMSLQEAATEQAGLFTAVHQQYNTAADMMGELDLKRVQLVKDSRTIKNDLTTILNKIEEIENEMEEQVNRADRESHRNNQLQNQINELLSTNDELKQQLVEVEGTHQSLVSSHSVQLNEIEVHMTRFKEELAEAECRIANEIQTNVNLKDNADQLLAEKTQLSMEIAELEIKMAEMEKEMEVKLEQMDKSWQTRYEEETKIANAKCDEMKDVVEVMNVEMSKLKEAIEKIGEELEHANQKYDGEKAKTEEMENKVGGMQAILEDRNKEIYSLHSKLNGEQKRIEEHKQQQLQKITDIESKLETLQKETEQKDSKIGQLETDLAGHASKVTTMEAQLKEKDEEYKVLKDKLTDAEQSQTRTAQLELALADQTSKVAILEQQLVARKENIRTNTDAINDQTTTQVTSTPMRPIELDSSPDMTPTKKIRISDAEESNLAPSESNYSSFQNSVHRKRAPTRFFTRKSPNKLLQQQPTQQQVPSNTRTLFGALRQSGSNDDLNYSFASTVNIDDELLEVANISSGSSVRLVKPFFRKPQEKK